MKDKSTNDDGLLDLTEAAKYLKISNRSSTVQKVKTLVLNDLEKAKIALALHFRAYLLIIYSSRNVGGSATPEARIAAEAFAWS